VLARLLSWASLGTAAGLLLFGEPVQAAQTAKPKQAAKATENAKPAPAASATSGEARVNGTPLVVAHAYLFHAPDSFNDAQVNEIAVLTDKPLDEAELKKATTLSKALSLAPERIVVDVGKDGKAEISICHKALEGSCYTTSISAAFGDWKPAASAKGHLAGHVRILSGHEETVFSKYKVFYEFTFDAAPVRDFAKRR
jgi:hypothetical protein